MVINNRHVILRKTNSYVHKREVISIIREEDACEKVNLSIAWKHRDLSINLSLQMNPNSLHDRKLDIGLLEIHGAVPRVALPPYSSRFPSLILSSGYCLHRVSHVLLVSM